MDFFLTNRALQPKFEVASYVASMGFPTPQSYTSFDEALQSGAPFIMRSEHPQDYDGVSGLLNSFRISEETFNDAQSYDPSQVGSRQLDHLLTGLKNRLAGGSDRGLEIELASHSDYRIRRYCKYLGLREEDFLSGVSYSYWAFLGGLNRTIVADSAIKDRYHIFTSASPNPYEGHHYTIIDGDRIEMSKGWRLSEEAIREGIFVAIDYYESIRRLPRFDANHCPIIECQLVEGLHYFLQYHRCRDFQPSTFELTRAPEEGEIEALFVRGETPPNGIVVNTALYYPFEDAAFSLEEREDASFDFHWNLVFSELMSRRRTVNFSKMKNLADIALKTVDAHLPKSQLFKPQVSLASPFGNLLAPIAEKAFEMTEKNKTPFRVPIRVVADGRRALVKFLGETCPELDLSGD